MSIENGWCLICKTTCNEIRFVKEALEKSYSIMVLFLWCFNFGGAQLHVGCKIEMLKMCSFPTELCV